jgi:hypothetical protein
MFLSRLLFVCCLIVAGSDVSAQDEPPLIKVGIIGCDTSHAIAFTKILNNPKATGTTQERSGGGSVSGWKCRHPFEHQ